MGFLTGTFFVVKIVVLVLVGLVLAGLVFAGMLIAIFWTWAKGKGLGHPLMKFKQWRDLYNLNPEEWNVTDSHPYRCIYSEGHHKDIYVRFSFVDTFRFMLWQSYIEKRRKQKCNNEKLQLLLRAAQSDIDKLRAQSEQELEEVRTRTEQVRTQLGKGEVK